MAAASVPGTVSFDADALHILSHVVKKMKKRAKSGTGPLEVTEAVAAISEHIDSVVQKDTNGGSIAAATPLVDRLTTMRVLLNTLLAALDKKLDLPSKGVVPRMKRGFLALPNELVVLIFEYATSYEVDVNPVSLKELLMADRSSPRTLASINRRFRQVVLASPRLWAFLRNSQNAYVLREHLKWSKECDLTIWLSLDEDYDEDDWQGFMNFLLADRRRWRNLVVTAFDDDAGYHLTRFEHSFPILHLPRLHKLILGFDESGIYYDRRPGENYHFYAHWTMPNLESLGLQCITPPVEAFLSFSSVTSCNIRVSLEGFDMAMMLKCLESLSHLKTLDILFDEVRDLEVEDLPSVESCLQVLHVAVHETMRSFYTGFMSALRTPYVSEISVSISLDLTSGECGWEIEEGEGLFDWIDDPLGSNQKYYCLKRLKLDIRDRPHGVYLSPFFSCAPNLEVLDIVAPDFRLDTHRCNYPPHLRTLRFTDFDHLDDSSLKALSETNGRNSLERLDFVRCRRLSRSAVEKRFPKTKIYWM